MAAISTIKNVLAPLLNPNSGLNILPKNLSFGAVADPTGGHFTGDIVISNPRTTTGIISSFVKNFAPLVSLSPQGIATNLAEKTLQQVITPAGSGLPGTKIGEVPMGYFDSLFDSGGSSVDTTGFDAGFGGTGGSGIDFSGLFNTGVQALGSFLTAQQGSGRVPITMADTVPMVAGGAMVARGIGALATRFPQLAARLGALNLSRSAAYSMLKKFGPAALTGIGFAAVEVAQLASSGSGRRHMNICNGRALRRANRRVQAFHNFYKRTCGTSVRRRKTRC
jgi:hypothetical protein